jgi:hypothetical protein
MRKGSGYGFRARDFVAPRNDRRGVLARGWSALIVLAAALTLGANAQDYPSRPVKVIISITAGAGPDVITRVVGEHLGKLWGQQVVLNQAVTARRRRAPSAARS